MGSPSKENNVLKLFLNESTKHWHFNVIVKTAKISEPAANKWIKKLLKEDIIKRIKPRDRMPYFIANYTHPNYYNKKKLFALNRMSESGLLSQLQSLEKVKTVVIFGSFARGDWHTGSDIDVFILGNPGILKFGTRAMGREVEVHTCKNKKEINEIQSGLMKNVIKGYFVKGNVSDLLEAIA